MSGHKSHDKHAAPTAQAPSGLVGRIVGLPLGLLAFVKRKPLVGGPAVGAGLLLFLGAAWWLLSPGKKVVEQTPAEILAEAFEQMDAGEHAEARRLAAKLRVNDALAYEELAGPMLILGTVMAHDAENYPDADQQRLLYRVAARYLEEARDRGLPEDRAAAGMFLLGRCLYAGGRYVRASEALTAALEIPGQTAKTEIERLLAESLLKETPPRVPLALQHLDAYLADASLTLPQREAGLLWRGRVALDHGLLPEARKTLDQLAVDSGVRNERHLLEARLLSREADQVSRDPSSTAAQEEKLREALERLRAIQSRDGTETHLAPKVQYLMGDLLARLGDLEEAEHQWTRVRSEAHGTDDGLAATFRLAELLVRGKKFTEGAKFYTQAFTTAAERQPFVNAWLTTTDVAALAKRSYDELLAAQQYRLAIEFTQQWYPVLDEDQGVALRAQARRLWAQHLERQAAQKPYGQRTGILSDARMQWRAAGADFARRAELSRPTRRYEEELWNSAECYLQGQAYAEAAARLRQLLKERGVYRRPDALAALGHALLSQGQVTTAVDMFRQCLEEHPRHPASYRSRLHGALAMMELGQIEEARQWLSDNLYNFGLTPQSVEWRDSLFALGESQYRDAMAHDTKSRATPVTETNPEALATSLQELEQAHQTFLDAAHTLTEAVQRFSDTPQALEARYRVAESYRRAARYPQRKLATTTIETSKAAINRQIQEMLTAAVDEYTRLLQQFDDHQEAGARTPVEAAIVRNSYFGKADALFDLGRWEDAALAYSAATNRYQQEPEALEAYVQIAACYRRLNRRAEARGTLEQARVVWQRIRPDAPFTQTTRFNRDEWGQLIEWLTSL